MTYIPHYKEETLLSPHETKFRVEVQVLTTEILEQNYCGEFVIEFQPLTHFDYCYLEEHISKVCCDLEFMKDFNSQKEIRPKCQSNAGFFFATQLFPPKLNVADLDDYLLDFQNETPTASITGHFRDLPNGEVVINLDYIDFDAKSNGALKSPNGSATFQKLGDKPKPKVVVSITDVDDDDW